LDDVLQTEKGAKSQTAGGGMVRLREMAVITGKIDGAQRLDDNVAPLRVTLFCSMPGG
jgi:hypothetical protein